ncbi:MAG TPA: DUF3108 domain-containing protein [Beijerinckiaceae bacterium]|jgi:hypothetical protein
MRHVGTIVTALLAVVPGLGAASATTLNAEYAISLAGLTVGMADLATTVEGDKYRLQLNARTVGLAGAFSNAKGAANAAGSVAPGRPPVPGSFAVLTRASSDQRSVRIGIANGNVAAVDITPPLDPKPDRVPLKDSHKRGIVDPLSALIMPAVAGSGDLLDPANCNRTLPIFDGGARYDVTLSFAETRRVERPGFAGPVLVCNARWTPIAGHRSERPATKFMQENQDISVWLAPIEGTRVLIPLRISVATMIGTSVIEAQRWSQSGEGKPAPAKPQRRAGAD